MDSNCARCGRQICLEPNDMVICRRCGQDFCLGCWPKHQKDALPGNELSEMGLLERWRLDAAMDEVIDDE